LRRPLICGQIGSLYNRIGRLAVYSNEEALMGDVGEGAGGGQHGVSERPEGILLHQGSLAVPESSAGSGDESVDPSEPISDEVHQADRLGAEK